jgi:hypothetical protein
MNYQLTLTAHEMAALRMLAASVKRNPEKFKAMSQLIPARMLLSKMLEVLLEDAKAHHEYMKGIHEVLSMFKELDAEGLKNVEDFGPSKI